MPSKPTVPTIAAVEADLGLRERKKLRTRRSIREAARRLIEEQGYEHTTIEQIAAEAEVSPSTVFRYFPTKEHIVLTDEFAASGIDLLRSRPADEPPLVALRETLTGMVHHVYGDYGAEYRWRRELVRTVPTVRAFMYEAQYRMVDAACAALAERTGRPADDLELRVVVGAMTGAFHQVLWGDHSEEGDLLDLIDRALAVLNRGLVL
ncbi:TetR/AcrR family transcriptional regulator [Actinomadura sp. 7K534]|uniref:TetR/AcrR family transcriptional regulator n=1 Tax=Actinomadura sp. 7K534 TaxID=2530366 RepID=UPI001050B626|nr:TetR/AcrR family transcriptional regulator [Actinomadura sp. 7K534]TDB97305.1 TetR family transcriptional regulator [Actinomadura sp. 7K534]